ncbi:MAG: HIT family protein [Candidatus Nealsonbacteria bacterium]|nr:HIT family protein [Candidatus Nealsonbacteria bacterium]
MGDNDIVCQANVARYYGESPDLLEEYRRITEGGKCPFCPEGIREKNFKVLGETDHWTIVHSQYPYKNVRLHLLAVPKRHIISSAELSRLEWADLAAVVGIAIDNFPFLSQGFGWGVREKEAGGVTLYHLHFHLIAPEVNCRGLAEIAVNFGIG